jgi:hypothetical protein
MKRCFRSPEHENLYRQTPSIWLQTSVGLAAWLWLAPVAEAQPTYTPVPLDNPTPKRMPALPRRWPVSGI